MKIVLLGLFTILMCGQAQAQHYGKPAQDSVQGRSLRTGVPQVALDLKQNYPNPFARSTQIQFSVASEMEIVFKVHDLLGNTVLRQNISAVRGVNSYIFERGTLPSGFYFYTVEAGSATFTKRMMIRD